MKNIALCSLVFLSALTTSLFNLAHADDPVTERQNIAKYEKDVARDQLKVATQQSDIKTEQAVLTRDIAQYGSDSSQARADRDRIKGMQKDLAIYKADRQKDEVKKQAQAGGQVPDADLQK